MRKQLPMRQIHLDFHTSPYIDGVGEKFDAEAFAKTLLDAHVNSINIFAKCHHGMYYYPTKIGTMHPHLRFDLFGAQLAVCRKYNIRALAYTCVSWNEDWADRHPEWLTIPKGGVPGVKRPGEKSFYAWRHICHNNKDYQKILQAEYREIFDLYHPDGFWIDIVQGKHCVCETCSEEMRELGLDPECDADVERFDRISETAFCRTMYQYIKSLDGNLEVFFNSHPYRLDDGEDIMASSVEKRKYFDFVDIESLPSDQWGYVHFPVAVNYLNKYDQPLCMMNGKFFTAWGDFGSLRHPVALEYECLRGVANGASVCVGDQLHPCGALDAPVYERIGNVFAKIEALEPWLINTRKMSEIAVLIPSKAGVENAQAHRSEEGVCRILTELHYLFDYVNVEDSLEPYKLLILPDEVSVRVETAEKIERFVQGGGKVLMSGTSCLKDGRSQLPSMAVTHLGNRGHAQQYLRLDSEYFAGIPAIDHVLYEGGERICGGEVLAQIVEPYFERSYEKFCSHRQTPPRPEAGEDAGIVRCEGGICLSSPIFRMYCDYGYTIYRDILARCLAELVPAPYLSTDLPAISELTLRKHEEGYVLHMLNYVITRRRRSWIPSRSDSSSVTVRFLSAQKSARRRCSAFRRKRRLRLPMRTA
ncbi:MAG: beta-galactosidase trimerization domain-containing protein [Lachnospiraceae bacterium]|nr:beta-galactosidase trimerization domain-containing protein [Lachnospiraceae bacterium]